MSEYDRIKAELSSTLSNLRAKKGMTKKDVHSALNMSQKELSRIERGEFCPTFVNAVRLINLYGGSINDIARVFDAQYGEANLAYDFTDNHNKRLGQYVNEEYCCHFVSTQDPFDRNIDEMKIKTKAKIGEGFLAATAIHNDYEYDVKVVSPMEYDYTFFYMTSKGNLTDRAVLIFPFIREIRSKFVAGVGIMLSFSTDSPSVPCFQKVMIFSEREYWNVRRVIANNYGIQQFLALGNTQTVTSQYKIMMNSLVEETKSLHAKCQKEKNIKRK